MQVKKKEKREATIEKQICKVIIMTRMGKKNRGGKNTTKKKQTLKEMVVMKSAY